MMNFQKPREVIINMIEKKITYNQPKPTKASNIKPVRQGGRLNYLGKQKTITAPVKWKSGPTHPVTHLAYITDEEEDILVKLDLYKSMNGKPNKGPFGLPSLNDGDGSGGGGSGGDGAGAGDSGGSGGSGGSDASGDAGNATGDSAGVGGSGDSTGGEGAGSGPGGEAGTGGIGGIGGIGIGDAVSNVVSNVVNSITQNPVATAIGIAMGPVAGLAARGIANAISASNRGVTGPSDDTQESASVQSSNASTSDGGGITDPFYYQALAQQAAGQPLSDMQLYTLKLRQNLGLPV
jgi:hypothetical protein